MIKHNCQWWLKMIFNDLWDIFEKLHFLKKKEQYWKIMEHDDKWWEMMNKANMRNDGN